MADVEQRVVLEVEDDAGNQLALRADAVTRRVLVDTGATDPATDTTVGQVLAAVQALEQTSLTDAQLRDVPVDVAVVSGGGVTSEVSIDPTSQLHTGQVRAFSNVAVAIPSPDLTVVSTVQLTNPSSSLLLRYGLAGVTADTGDFLLPTSQLAIDYDLTAGRLYVIAGADGDGAVLTDSRATAGDAPLLQAGDGNSRLFSSVGDEGAVADFDSSPLPAGSIVGFAVIVTVASGPSGAGDSTFDVELSDLPPTVSGVVGQIVVPDGVAAGTEVRLDVPADVLAVYDAGDYTSGMQVRLSAAELGGNVEVDEIRVQAATADPSDGAPVGWVAVGYA